MQVHTVADLGSAVREARRRRGQTQSELARALGVSVSWLSRLENGGPRLESQLVLDAVLGAGVTLYVEADGPTSPDRTDDGNDPFADVFDRTRR